MDIEDEELTHMIVELKKLYSLPSLKCFTSLIELNCSYNCLERLPKLPDTLKVLQCNNNLLHNLPNLPNLISLRCYSNNLDTLPRLPDSLQELYCGRNKLDKIPKLPEGILHFNCSYNNLTKLPNLPMSTQIVYCSDNQLTQFPKLPDTLTELHCSNNKIVNIHLPTHLCLLDCNHNLIEHLSLNLNLQKLECSHNHIHTIHLNEQLINMNLSYNRILSMPLLPISISHINMKYTNIETCFDIHTNIEKSEYLFFYGTPLYTKVSRVLKTELHITEPTIIKMAFERIRSIEYIFRFHYYCLKLKEKLVNWMWRSRENIAMKKYHPEHLVEWLSHHDYDTLEHW